MPKFISDADMLKLESSQTKKEFISDEEMLKLEQPEEESILKQVARGVISAVPAVGALAGGAFAGAGTLGLGSVAGGALGYAGGKEVEGLLNKYLLDEEGPSTAPIDQLGRVAGNIAEGATYEMGGQILGKGIEKAAPYVTSGLKGIGAEFKGGASKVLADDLGLSGNPQQIRKVTDLVLDNGISLFKKTDPNLINQINVKMGGKSLNKVADKVIDWGILPTVALTGHPVAAAAGYVGKKVLQSSPGQRTLALGLNNIGKMLQTTPEVFGKFTPILQKAAERGGNSLAATHFLLQQTQPEYQDMTSNLGQGEEDE